MPKAERSQNYAFTCYPREGDLERFKALDCDHILLAEETCPTSGRLHWQSCIRWKVQRPWKESRSDLNWSDYRMCDQKYEYSVRYCLKGSQSHEEYDRDHEYGPNYGKDLKIVFEGGKRPMTQKRKGECGEEYAARNIKACMEGRYKDMDPRATLRIRDYRAAANALRDPPTNLPAGGRGTYHEWHFSPSPGTGKDFHCRTQQKTPPYIHEGNEWWDDYDFEDVVYLVDVGRDLKKLSTKLRQVLDEWTFRAPVKGSMMHIRPKKVLITANFHPSESSLVGVELAAILDRVKVFYWGDEKYLMPDKTRNPLWRPPRGLNQSWYDLQHPTPSVIENGVQKEEIREEEASPSQELCAEGKEVWPCESD